MLRRGDFTRSPLLTHSIFILSHVLITAVSYLWVDEITQGWLFINIWHNAQYLVFVWVYNARRTQSSSLEARVTERSSEASGGGSHDPLAFLRSLSHPTLKSLSRYLILCVTSGTLFFLLIDLIISLLERWTLSEQIAHLMASTQWALPAQSFSLLLVIHLSINFHHYLVDAVIWRRRHRESDHALSRAQNV